MNEPSRVDRVRTAMADAGVDALLLSLGADLPWLTGYAPHESERLTMLVLPVDETATMVVPELEAAKVVERPDVFTIRAWRETDDPIAVVADLVGGRRSLAVSDRAWSYFLLRLQAAIPGARWQPASVVTTPLRARKDTAEIEALRRAAESADRVAAALLKGEIPLVGRTEKAVSSEIARRLRDEGHDRVGFSIVGSGPNGASPHHDASARVIEAGEAVVCDFGGWVDGYCSDITRTVFTGDPPSEFVDLYGVLQRAQAAAVDAAVVGTPCEEVDGVARGIIGDAGYGDLFIHRTGHGIGLEGHEHPYLVSGNAEPLAPGHAFSIEPGIYVAGRWGARIEDIVVATGAGPLPLNTADHDLHVVEA